MVSYIKGGFQAKGIWKQDPEANIWAQEGWEWGVEKAPNLYIRLVKELKLWTNQTSDTLNSMYSYFSFYPDDSRWIMTYHSASDG